MVALANKLARIAVMTREEDYRKPDAVAEPARGGEAMMTQALRLAIPTSGRIAPCSLRQAACGGGPGGPALPSAARGAPGTDRSG